MTVKSKLESTMLVMNDDEDIQPNVSRTVLSVAKSINVASEFGPCCLHPPLIEFEMRS